MVEEVKIIMPTMGEIKETYHEIPYNEYVKFKELYPHSGRERVTIGKDYVVKKLEAIDSYDLVVELNAYNMLDHHCILKPIAWSYKNKHGYLASPKGKNIIEAYNDKDITIEEILSDILSVIAFLNKNGYVHGDIKPANIVFHEGRAKLIDFGRFSKAVLNEDGQYYISGVFYTYIYRDPEYVESQHNNIKCEIYSIAATCKEIMTNKIPYFGDVYGYKYEKGNVNWFLDQAALPINERKDIHQIIKEAPKDLIVRTYTGRIILASSVPLSNSTDKRLVIILSWLTAIAYTFKLDVEVLFLGFHIIYRLYERYKNTFEDKKSFNDILQIFGCVCLDLAINVLTFDTLTVSEWKHLSDMDDDDDYKEKYIRTYLDVLLLSDGILISPTWWDYAQSKEQLEKLLFRTINGSYNPYLIKDEDEEGKETKLVTVNNLLARPEFKKLVKSEYPKAKKSSTRGNQPRIIPSKLVIKGDKQPIENIWTEFKPLNDNNIHDFLPVVLHNRDILNQLDVDISIAIYTKLSGLVSNSSYSQLAKVFLNRMPQDWKDKIAEVFNKE